MKFLIDAQLPMRFVGWLRRHGHDTLHTLDLPLGNRTPDSDVVACVIRDDRIVVTKNSDFVQTFLLPGQPARLRGRYLCGVAGDRCYRCVCVALTMTAAVIGAGHSDCSPYTPAR